MNSMLEPRGLTVKDLQEDLADGLNLVAVCEVAGKNQVKGINKRPTMKIQKINNLNLALQQMTKEFDVRLDLISAEDIFGGNLKMILGMIWSLFRKVGEKLMGVGADGEGSEAGLLKWVREMTDGYEGVHIHDFKTSFNDGKAFSALVHRFDSSLVDYDEVASSSDKAAVLERAFDLAEKHLGVPKLLDVNDLLSGDVDERSVILYGSLYFHAFVSNEERIKARQAKEQISGKMTAVQAELAQVTETLAAANADRDRLRSDNDELLARLKALEERLDFLQAKRNADADTLELLEDKCAVLGGLLEQEKGARTGVESERHRLQSEMEELRDRLSRAQQMSESEVDELKKRLATLEEEEERIRQEREEARKKLEETAEDYQRALDEAEKRKQSLAEQIQSLRDTVQQEISRRRRKAAEAEALRKENAALRRRNVQQTRARSALAALKRNLEEHLEDMHKWRELHHGAVEGSRFDLATVASDLEGKPFEDQLSYLDEHLQEENRSLIRIVKLEDSKRQLQEKIEKQGALKMKFRKDWRERWFRVAGHKLSWYENDETTRREGAVDLTKKCDIVRQKAVKADDGSGAKLWPLKLTVNHEGQDKKLFIRAASKRERHSWFSLISAKIAAINYVRDVEASGNRPDTRVIAFLQDTEAEECIVDNRPVHAESATAIAKVIPGHDTVHTVSLSGAALGAEQFAILAPALGKSQSLRVVKLDRNALNDAAAAELAQSLGAGITSLNVAHNQIGAEGAAAIAAAIAAYAALEHLDISHNPLGNDGAAAIADAVAQSNRPLAHLHLASANIGDAAATGPIAALLAAGSFADVDLSGNQIGDDGAAAIAQALQTNSAINSLDLSGNPIHGKGLDALCQLLQANQDIQTVRLSNIPATPTDALAALIASQGFHAPDLTISRSNE
jgi:cortexillin 1/2